MFDSAYCTDDDNDTSVHYSVFDLIAADDDDTSTPWLCETTIPSESVCSNQRKYRHVDHRQYQEHAFRIASAASLRSFHYAETEAVFGRRYQKRMFPKSGFIGRIGKKRKGML